MSRYVALLRGINVGGRNLIRMADLRACFEQQGFRDVATWIQSGNVIFSADRVAADALATRIERALAAAFDYPASVVLRSQREMRRVVEGAPRGFGSAPSRYRYDVLFLKRPLTAAVALPETPAREGVDEVRPGPGVLYYSRLISKASQSRLGKVTALPVYQQMTVRNWNTTTRLLRMMA